MKYKENWNALIKIKFIPKKYREQQKRLGQAFSELNSIRNMVMHPVKPYRYRKEMFDKVQIALQDFNIKFVSNRFKMTNSYWRNTKLDKLQAVVAEIDNEQTR